MSVSIGELTGELSLEDKFSEAFELILHEVEKGAEELETAFGAIALGVGIVAAAVVGTTAAIIGMAAQGAELNDIHEGFDRLSGSVENADAILAAMRTGVAGTIDDLSLMQDANRALATGAVKTAEQFGTMTSAARVLSREGFGPIEQQMSTIERALTTGRTRQLQYMVGVIDLKGAEEAYAKSLGVTRDQLSAQGKLHADQIAIYDKLNQRIREAGEQNLNFAEKVKAAEVAVMNWTHDLLMAVGASPAVNQAFDDIGAAILRAFGGSGKTAQEFVLQWIDKFATAVGHYGPIIIDWMRQTYDEIVSIWHAVQAAWDTVPDWFKSIARDAALAGGAVYLTSKALETIGGSDMLGNLANIAQIWSVIEGGVIKATAAVKEFGIVTLVVFRTGGLAAIISEMSVGLTALAATPVGIAALIAALGAALYQVAMAIGSIADNWKRGGETVWGFLTLQDDDTFVRRWLNLSKAIDKVKESADNLAHIKPIMGFADPIEARESGSKRQFGTSTTSGSDVNLASTNAEYAKLLETIDKVTRAGWNDSVAMSIMAGELTNVGTKTTDIDVLKHSFDALEASIKAANDATRNIPLSFPSDIDKLASNLGGNVIPTTHSTTGFMGALPSRQVGVKVGFDLGSSFTAGFENGMHDLPTAILDAIKGGGSVIGAVGGTFGQSVGESINKGLQKSIASSAMGGFSKTILSGLSSAIPVIGALAGPLLDKLFSLGGPSKQELAGRDVATNFQKQFASFDDMMGKVGQIYAAEGKSAQQAQADVKALFDAEKQGADAASAAAKIIQDNLDRYKATSNAMSEFGLSIGDAGKAFANSQLIPQGDALAMKFRDLEQAGFDVTTVTVHMADAINAYVAQCMQAGVAVPASMAEIVRQLESQGLATARLTALQKDAFTKSVDNLDALFAHRQQLSDQVAGESPEEVIGVIESQTRSQIAVLDKDIVDQQDKLAKMAQAAGTDMQAVFRELKIDPVHVQVIWDVPNLPSGGSVNTAPSETSQAAGTDGIRHAVGPMTFTTKGNEDYAFSGEGKSFGSGGSDETADAVHALREDMATIIPRAVARAVKTAVMDAIAAV